jgi:hypothetical protein
MENKEFRDIVVDLLKEDARNHAKKNTDEGKIVVAYIKNLIKILESTDL